MFELSKRISNFCSFCFELLALYYKLCLKKQNKIVSLASKNRAICKTAFTDLLRKYKHAHKHPNYSFKWKTALR